MPSQDFTVMTLTTEQWRELILDYYRQIKPLLRKLTLPKLGDLICLPTMRYGWSTSLRSIQKHFNIPPRPILDVPGIFWPTYPKNDGSLLASEEQHLWGINRKGQWVIVELDIVSDESQSYCLNNPRIRPSSLDEILTLVWSPAAILKGMSHSLGMIENLMEQRLLAVKAIYNPIRDDLQFARGIPENEGL